MKIVKKVFKWCSYIIAGLFVLGMLTTMFSNEVVEQVTETSTEVVESKEEAKEEIVYQEIKAENIIALYENNELKADSMLKNVRCVIVGKVSNIERVLGQVYVTLKSNNEYGITEIQCYFDDDNLEALTELNTGDIVKIEGTIEGKGWNINVKDCILIS